MMSVADDKSIETYKLISKIIKDKSDRVEKMVMISTKRIKAIEVDLSLQSNKNYDEEDNNLTEDT